MTREELLNDMNAAIKEAAGDNKDILTGGEGKLLKSYPNLKKDFFASISEANGRNSKFSYFRIPGFDARVRMPAGKTPVAGNYNLVEYTIMTDEKTNKPLKRPLLVAFLVPAA